jgi:two-component system cell cycle response regulator
LFHLANILIAATDPALGQDCQAKLRRHGYQCRVVTSFDALVAASNAERPEAIMVAGDFSPAELSSLPDRLAGGEEIPICLVPLAGGPDMAMRAIAAGVDDVMPPPLGEDKLLARLRPLVRLSVMRSELRLRASITRRFGVETAGTAAPATLTEDYPVLVVGPCDSALADALGAARLTVAADPIAAEELVAARDFDAVVLVATGDAARCLAFSAQLRKNPRLFNLPVVVIGDASLDESIAYRHGVNGVFARPFAPPEVRGALLALVRQQRSRRAILLALNATLTDATRDLATGAADPVFLEAYLADRVRTPAQAARDLAANVYSRAFLDAYLAGRLHLAGEQNRPLSVIHFRLSDQPEMRRAFGAVAAEHLRSQAAQWITGLLRGEDLTGRYDQDEFCVVLPDTPGEEAEVVMNRIAGVLAYTDFAALGVYRPVKAWVNAGSAELAAGDMVESLTDRARRGFSRAGQQSHKNS